MKTIGIIQSAYIPWKGYMEFIRDCDVFVMYDDVQFTKRDWRSRNRIKSPLGLKWLSVPTNGTLEHMIDEVQLSDPDWARRHLASLQQAYRSAPFWKEYQWLLDRIYRTPYETLSDLNMGATKALCEALGITTELLPSRPFNAQGRKAPRLIDIIQQLGGDRYISGPAAKSYITDEFEQAGIELRYKSYVGYPEYEQLHGDFEHAVTVLDLLFMLGPEAPHHIWGWREAAGVSTVE